MHAAEFSMQGSCEATLPPGGICTIGIQFTPTSAGAKNAGLNVVAGGVGEAVTVSLSGAGTGAEAEVQISPTSRAFGEVRRGTTSTKTVAVINSGGVDVPIVRVRLTGSNANQFQVSHACGASVAVGSSCIVSITFRPTSRGQKNAKVSLEFGAGIGTRTVPVKGVGT
jgi:hypothetical protein